MVRGPIFNDSVSRFTTRNSLGIEAVLTTIAEKMSPIVSTVNDRAFYWPFMVWIFYEYSEYLKRIGENDRKFDSKFMKRQDYFFVLSQIVVGNEDIDGMAGITASTRDFELNQKGPYPYNDEYYQHNYGGMQYASGGCHLMGLIEDYNEDGEAYKFPHPTAEGRKMAKAFKSVIKDTTYYKHYLFSDEPIPKSVLEEYGNTINMALRGFDECKQILKNRMFLPEENRKLKMSSEYVKFLVETHDINTKNMTRSDYRYYLFDCYSPKGENRDYPKNLSEIVKGWEIMVGRQYLTLGLEMIWKYMLQILEEPYTYDNWIKKCKDQSVLDFSLEDTTESLLKKCEYHFSEREKMIDDAKHSRNEELMMANGLKILLSVYKRFSNREDIIDDEYFGEGDENQSVSMREVFAKINELKEKPVKMLLSHIMNVWLIEQHLYTATQKAKNGKDGFYIEKTKGSYYRRHEFDLNYQGVRLVQLTKVMNDLEMI